MAQTVQILRTTTNNPPPTLLPGSFSVELGADTRLWMGAVGGNRLLLSSNSADVDLAADCTIAATAPTVGTQTGILWFDTVSGGLFVRFNDGSSTQWIQPVSAGSALNVQTGPGLTLNTSTSPPTIDFANPYPQAMTINAALRVQTAGAVIGPAATATPGAGALTLNANTVAPPAGFANNLSVVGADGTAPLVGIDAFGSANGQFRLRRARGTAAAPTAVQSGDFLGGMGTQGASSSTTYGNGGSVLISATENWTTAAQGCGCTIYTTINGGTTSVPSLSLAGNSATFSGNVFSGGNVIVPSGGAFSVTGGIVIGTGFSTKAGNSGATDGHTFNIYYGSGPAHLWIDNSDIGSINTTPCDERLKTNLKAPTVDALAAINAIALKQFDWLANDLAPGHHEDIGFTAQQLAKAIPCAVDLHEDDPDRMASVQLTPIVANLIGAVQQLTARLEKLEGAK